MRHGLLSLRCLGFAICMPIDLFPQSDGYWAPGRISIPVGMNSNLTGVWGVVKVGPGMVAGDEFTPGWPAGIADDRIWRYNRQLSVYASGSLNSGVLFSGSTDPNGWTTFAEADSGTPWVKAGVPRYSLLAAFTTLDFPDPSEWFYVGQRYGFDDSGNETFASWLLPMAPTPAGTAEPWEGPDSEWRRVFLACNRPPPGPTGGGDGAWTVMLRVQILTAADVPTCSPVPTTRSAACQSHMDAIPTLRTHAGEICTASHRALDDANAANIAITALGVLWAGTFSALALFTGGAFGAPTAPVQTAISQAVFTWQELVAGIAVGGVVAGSVVLAEVMDPLWTTVSVAVTVATAILIAWAIGKAVAALATGPAGWGWAALVFVGCALLGGLLVAFLVEVGAAMGAIREHDRQTALFSQAQNDFDAAVAGAERFCCPAVVAADPRVGSTATPTC